MLEAYSKLVGEHYGADEDQAENALLGEADSGADFAYDWFAEHQDDNDIPEILWTNIDWEGVWEWMEADWGWGFSDGYVFDLSL